MQAQLLKGMKWLLIMLLAIPLTLYLLIIVINLFDEDKSSTVLEFEQFLSQRSKVEDKDNAFNYAFDLTAPSKKNNQTFNFTYKKQLNDILTGCGLPIAFTEKCIQNLHHHKATINTLLEHENNLLDKYQYMANLSQWYETKKSDPFSTQTLSLGILSDLQKLIMLKAWQHATAGNYIDVKQLLTQDIKFWRTILASSHSLINKTVAGSKLEQHFIWASIVLSSLPENLRARAIPSNWQKAITADEKSFSKVAIGEWQYTQAVLLSTLLDQKNLDTTGIIIQFLSKPLFKLQATLNLRAHILEQTSKTLLQSSKDNICPQGFMSLFWYSYNPIGKMLMCLPDTSFTSYQNKVNNLEQIRLKALTNF